jgi:beta-phosphoglucomutase-like phosphatase (HAD superfamily)
MDHVSRYGVLLLFAFCFEICAGFCRLGSSIGVAQERTSRALQKHRTHRPPSQPRRLWMVRNIDLPEALIFYGVSAVVDYSSGEPRDGLEAILRECAEIETATVLLVTRRQDEEILAKTMRPAAATSSFTAVRWQQEPAPNPADLLGCIDSITVQPRPFGGSSGFGSKPADPERNPLPRHCVAFTTTVDQTRAARAAGMRVIAIDCNSSNQDDSQEDDLLADAVIRSYEEVNGLDDIATPGSFWLNPPHPRDDEGNAVDPEWLASCATEETVGIFSSESFPDDEMDDEDLQAILADIAPLNQ